MNERRLQWWAVFGFVLAMVLHVPTWAAAQTTFQRIVVFGDSLSDPGNLFALEGINITPPYDTLDSMLIPDNVYARGGHHLSNGPTWIEQYARTKGLAADTRPAFQDFGVKATNYAVSGARAHEDGINVNLGAQLNEFLNDFRGKAPSDALYVIEFGSNDIRDILAGGDPATIFSGAFTAIGNSIATLYAAGARKFLICNAPDFSLTPAILQFPEDVRAIARLVSVGYNQGLEAVVGQVAAFPEIEIVRLDFFTLLTAVVAAPALVNLSVVDQPCITPGIPPFTCKDPGKYMFWDGAHPTKAGHAIMAHAAATVLAE